jgi:hypothetical protein
MSFVGRAFSVVKWQPIFVTAMDAAELDSRGLSQRKQSWNATNSFWRIGALQWAVEKYGTKKQKRRAQLEREGNWLSYRQAGSIPKDK